MLICDCPRCEARRGEQRNTFIVRLSAHLAQKTKMPSNDIPAACYVVLATLERAGVDLETYDVAQVTYAKDDTEANATIEAIVERAQQNKSLH